ncbi:hypothetical protein CCACVL1_12158 [Corchorus capsularis]|uniref:Uncharacterized protein n=1 Tax=Corchorus capsularis TaxID=210143 RepID=A0A1R3IH51_COCAP|nr:hypothetical protein CCACVL1_12158 [Corchorus capsularis]
MAVYCSVETTISSLAYAAAWTTRSKRKNSQFLLFWASGL